MYPLKIKKKGWTVYVFCCETMILFIVIHKISKRLLALYSSFKGWSGLIPSILQSWKQEKIKIKEKKKPSQLLRMLVCCSFLVMYPR